MKPSEENIKSCIIGKKSDRPHFPNATKRLVTTNPTVAEEACVTDLACC